MAQNQEQLNGGGTPALNHQELSRSLAEHMGAGHYDFGILLLGAHKAGRVYVLQTFVVMPTNDTPQRPQILGEFVTLLQLLHSGSSQQTS
jgi:hypothetical protein